MLSLLEENKDIFQEKTLPKKRTPTTRSKGKEILEMVARKKREKKEKKERRLKSLG